MMGYGWGMGVGGWIAMGIFWVALVTLVVWLVVQALPGRDARRNGPDDRSTTTETAEQILDRRYAAGELDLDTYQKMRAHLASGRSAEERGPR